MIYKINNNKIPEINLFLQYLRINPIKINLIKNHKLNNLVLIYTIKHVIVKWKKIKRFQMRINLNKINLIKNH